MLADEPPLEDLWLLDGQAVLLSRACLGSYTDALQSSLPEVAHRMELRGYDWIGRPIGVARSGEVAFLYDGAFEEMMEFDVPTGRLATSPLFDPSTDNFGAAEYLSFVRRLGVSRLSLGECAGFTVPPQLGGEVSSRNLEVYAVPTYWHLIALLQNTIGQLPEGTVLKDIQVA